ncbi:MAG: hypothetical protein SGARI_003737 [Bacillariaceae sp.]
MMHKKIALAAALLASSALGFELNCEPCVERSNKVVRAIYHGDVDDPFWDPIEKAAAQAGRDFNIDFESTLYENYNPTQMAADIRAATSQNVDALIVTLPSAEVEEAVKEAVEKGIAVFGLNSGYKSAAEIGIHVMVAQDEYLAGELAAQRFLTEMGNQPVISKAVFVNHEKGNVGLQDRFDGFKDGILSFNPNAIVKEVFIDVTTSEEEAAKELEAEIGSCTADVVLNGGNLASVYTLEAIEDLENKCTGDNGTKKALVGTFDTSEEIYMAIDSGDLLFAISQQPHLQAVLPVMFATQYVTTGMLPAKPLGSH